ncbi:hypothetical protein GCM10010987_80300 [Bradyrhizobium guangdongense]|uniref:Uncharacterized protein n=1 Tax=Bradyrhizobium guangdongense TaxID=1325090 RepID=A0A410UYC5_9BRAD|nr:hypothetical protein X265_00915 [Bradyrhizobium guangdongense]QOZ57456.1 hypothetical protein XH86_00915 [Bradyrhizobium guangdongense]GGI34637.1 hypothetical protein GCM10010987_80300 [Bradyrhizobium guangdongense]
MALDGQTTLTVHGLDGDNKAVRADVFTRKLRALLAGLGVADKVANGKSLCRSACNIDPLSRGIGVQN